MGDRRSDASERYTMIRQIGTGGMAEVWKASALGAAGFKKTVAMKKVLSTLAGDPEFVERFISEARVAAGLVHPNIVQVFDFGELEARSYFLAMEYVPGTDAASLTVSLEAEGRLIPPEVVLHIGMEVAKGLGYAHSRTPSIVHRDVSPSNVLVSFDGEVKLADFGIAKVAGSVTRSDLIQGKLAYISPEQARGEKVDGRSDIFSLGATLYRLLAGRGFLSGETFTERLAAASGYSGLTPEALGRIPGPLRGVIERALHVSPDDRYPNAEEMEAELSECLDLSSTIMTRRTLGGLARARFPEEYKRELSEVAEVITSKSADAAEPDPVTARSAPIGEQPAGTVSVSVPAPAAMKRSLTPILWVGGGIATLAVAATMLGPASWFGGSAATPTLTPTESPTPLAGASPSAVPSETPKAAAKATRTPVPKNTVLAAVSATPVATASRATIIRRVPKYELSFLDGCTADDLQRTANSISGAIGKGAPLYNKGDIEGCFQTYRATAASLQGLLPESCAGPRKGLQAGLDRAATLPTSNEKAWAMRDAFDGLLNVIGAVQ